MAGPDNILVIKLGALGDFVQALGPMAAIRRHHPHAHITLLTSEPFITLGRQCGYFNRIWTDEKPRWRDFRGWLALRRQLNDGNFTRVYDLQNNDRTSLYLRLMKPRPEWVGAAKGASHRNASPQRIAGHAYDGHVQTLALAGINDVTIDTLSWIAGDTAHFGIGGPYVLLVPGSAPGRMEKRWPAAFYAVLARTLYGWGYIPVILGTQDEGDIAQAVMKQAPRAVDLTGKTALTDIVLLARRAAAAIGNDTGPMHLIAPTGCPCYVLFSRHSDPVRHVPKGARVQTIREKELKDLPPETVIGALHVRDFRETS